MANLQPTDPQDTQPIDPRLPQPATHGQVKSSVGQHSIPEKMLKKHLSQHVQHLNTTKDYGAHGVGDFSHGVMSSGGAQGADYQTNSVGDTPDCDSAGPTGY